MAMTTTLKLDTMWKLDYEPADGNNTVSLQVTIKCLKKQTQYKNQIAVDGSSVS